MFINFFFFFFSSRRRHTRFDCDWSSDVCSSDLIFFALTFALSILYAHKNTADSAFRRELMKSQAAPQTSPAPTTAQPSPGSSPTAAPNSGVLPAGTATPATLPSSAAQAAASPTAAPVETATSPTATPKLKRRP